MNTSTCCNGALRWTGQRYHCAVCSQETDGYGAPVAWLLAGDAAFVRPLLDALREIANEDYRGPRPRSAQIAEKALRNYELDSQIGH